MTAVDDARASAITPEDESFLDALEAEAIVLARKEAEALLPELLKAQVRRRDGERKMAAARDYAAKVLRRWDEYPDTDPTQGQRWMPHC